MRAHATSSIIDGLHDSLCCQQSARRHDREALVYRDRIDAGTFNVDWHAAPAGVNTAKRLAMNISRHIIPADSMLPRPALAPFLASVIADISTP